MWIVLFILSVLAVVVSTIYAIRASYWVQPTIKQFNLDFDVTTDGKLLLGTAPGQSPKVPVSATAVAIGGVPVGGDLRVADLARQLDAAGDGPVALTVRLPNGRTEVLKQRRSTNQSGTVSYGSRDFRIWARLLAGLSACAALLTCSLLLALRRADEPVAMLLAFAFAGLAATIDPPLQFWLWTNRAIVLDVVGAGLFYCLLIGLASFPDGVFVPRLMRWLIPIGIPVAIFVSVPGMDEDAQGILAVALLIVVAASQAVRFRREPPGIARQQIKWAGFGFGMGLVLILGAVVLAAVLGDDPSTYTPLLSLTVLLLFSCGMVVLGSGLIIALLRFRLWEADTVITRSAAYAVVTVVVGTVWAASSDLVKLVITELMGRESEAGATTMGAIIAAGIFSPTQSVVLGWTRKRFGGPLDQIRYAAKRLKTWGLTETPEEVATRALAIIDSAVNPAASAIVMDTARDQRLIAMRNVASAADPRLVERIELADEETPMGTLLIGKRSDGKRYSEHELAAIREIIPSLAEALRVSRGRYSRDREMQQRLEEMATRLAQLEGGATTPA